MYLPQLLRVSILCNVLGGFKLRHIAIYNLVLPSVPSLKMVGLVFKPSLSKLIIRAIQTEFGSCFDTWSSTIETSVYGHRVCFPCKEQVIEKTG